MNILKLEKADKKEIVYQYQPEGTGACGEIVFSFASRDAKLSIRAAADTENNRYANKAIAKVKEFVDKKNLPLEYTQAWY